MDIYTKIVLTVIAAALSALAVENGTGAARAAGDTPMKVVICDPKDPTICAGVSNAHGSANAFFVHTP
jgi:hypothetical protein